jgi:hypothetical protein
MAEPEKIKQAEISYRSLSFKPVAKCVTDSCNWEYREVSYTSTKPAVMAKRHIVDHPIHIVEITQSNVSQYAVPDRVLLDKGYELPPEVPSD